MSAAFSVTLPLAQETFTRTFRMIDGENIVWVDSELENLLALDRPVFWGEHATISAPFLEPGKVVVDMPRSEGEDEGESDAAEPDAAAAVVRRFQVADGADDRWADVRRPFGADEAEHDRSHDIAAGSVATAWCSSRRFISKSGS